jgi:hypothetical protein
MLRVAQLQRMFDGLGYPDDYDAEHEYLYLSKLTGT